MDVVASDGHAASERGGSTGLTRSEEPDELTAGYSVWCTSARL